MESYKLGVRSRSLLKPDQASSSSAAANMTSLVTITPVAKCEYIFKEFASYAALELADVAHGLISPVILGMCKPCANRLISQSNSGASSNDFGLADELFNLEPSAQRQQSCAVSTSLVKVNILVYTFNRIKV